MNMQQDISVSKIQRTSLILLLAMAIAAWLLFSRHAAVSIFAGGGISILSFMWLKKDIRKIFSGPIHAAKILFFIKYYARLALLALLLYYIIRNQMLYVPGLLVGLSTVVLSIVMVGVTEAKKMYTTMKEAS